MVRVNKKCQDYLLAMSKRKRGHITAADVLADAKRPDSPLHALFDWNVESAAKKHWMVTAQEIIRSVKCSVVVEDRTIICRAFYRNPNESSGHLSITPQGGPPLSLDVKKAMIRQSTVSAKDAIDAVFDLACGLGLRSEAEKSIAAILEFKNRAE